MWNRNLSFLNEGDPMVNVSSGVVESPGSSSSSSNVTLDVSFLPLGLLILLLSFFGIVANFMSAVILLRPRMDSTYSTITLGLTFCDAIFLLTKLLRYGLQSMFTFFSVAREYTHVFYPIAGPAMKAITATSHTGLTYFTIAVAADRYFVLCWPGYARRLWSIKKAIFLSIGVLVFAMLYNLPQWWEFRTVIVETNNGTDFHYEMKATAFRKNRNYRVPYKIVHIIVMNFIPFLLLLFMNTQIWRKLQEARDIRRSITTSQRKEKSFSVMLFSVVVLFLVCSSVYFVKDILEISGVKCPSMVKNVGNVLLTFNSAVNFALYCMFGSRFRFEFVSFYKECLSSCLRRPSILRGSRWDLSTTHSPAPTDSKPKTNPT